MLAFLFAASWIGTWATAPSAVDATRSFTNTTLRQAARVSVGGAQVRVRLTNRFGASPLRTYEARGEQTRQAVNQFVRTSGVFDGVADFDAAVRDANDPHRLRSDDDSGDHLHPNAAAYRIMARAIDLSGL